LSYFSISMGYELRISHRWVISPYLAVQKSPERHFFVT